MHKMTLTVNQVVWLAAAMLTYEKLSTSIWGYSAHYVHKKVLHGTIYDKFDKR